MYLEFYQLLKRRSYAGSLLDHQIESKYSKEGEALKFFPIGLDLQSKTVNLLEQLFILAETDTYLHLFIILHFIDFERILEDEEAVELFQEATYAAFSPVDLFKVFVHGPPNEGRTLEYFLMNKMSPKDIDNELQEAMKEKIKDIEIIFKTKEEKLIENYEQVIKDLENKLDIEQGRFRDAADSYKEEKEKLVNNPLKMIIILKI